MREKWFEHSLSTNLITHVTEGENSGFVILRHQTLPLPCPNVDSISERIKGPGSFPVGFATWHMIHMPDHMPLKDSIWYSVGFFFFTFVFLELLVQFSIYFNDHDKGKKKTFVLEMNAFMFGNCESPEPIKTLVHFGVRIWQLQYVILTRIPWTILEYFIVHPL